MTQKQKGYVGLGVMLALGVGTVFGSDSLYKAIDVMSKEKVDYTPGTYVGSAQGFGGEVVATVTVGAAGIESVDLAGAGETPGIGVTALEQLPAAFVESNSSLVDTVAGATISSQAAMDAVQQALDQASGKIEVIAREAAPETEAEAEEKKDAPAGDAKGDYTPGTYEGSAKGFGGDVKATVVIGAGGGIESVELTGDGETPGLGADALKKLEPAFVEAGSVDVDAVAGSTISSEAAVKAVQAALDQASGQGDADDKKAEDAGKSAGPASYAPGTYEGSAKGFGGDVKATVVVGDAGIESVELSGSGETPELGGEALKKLSPAFVEAGSADVDGVAGCTITSDAAKKAVEAALKEAEAGEAAPASAQSAGNSYAPGTYEGSAKGLGGDVKATVVVGDAGIESVELSGSGETPELGGEALKKLGPAFVEAGSVDVDGVAGCTITSDAAKKAVEAALKEAEAGEAAPASAQAAGNSFKAGTYEGSAKGFGGDVKATVVVGDAGIESVELSGSGETPELGGEALKKLGPAFVEAGSADVDAVAGCTITSDAAKKAVQAALDQAK